MEIWAYMMTMALLAQCVLLNEKTVAVEITFSKSDGVDLVFSKILMCERY